MNFKAMNSTTALLVGTLFLGLGGCLHTQKATAIDPSEPPPPLASPSEPVLSTEEEGAYQQCLEDRMAVATAWELIEEGCRNSVRALNSGFAKITK